MYPLVTGARGTSEPEKNLSNLGVYDKGSGLTHLEVVPRDNTALEIGEGLPLLRGEVGLLEAQDIIFFGKIAKR